MGKYREAFDVLFDGLLTMPQDISENEKKLIFKSMDLLEEACDKADKYDEKETLRKLEKMSENTCVCCGEIIPEGRQYCINCGNVTKLVVKQKATKYKK